MVRRLEVVMIQWMDAEVSEVGGREVEVTICFKRGLSRLTVVSVPSGLSVRVQAVRLLHPDELVLTQPVDLVDNFDDQQD